MLYIVATPIGNLEDITLRALRVLGEVDYIAAEDTRRTVKLLNHYEIKTKLVSFHEHSGDEKRAWILAELEAGRDIALVSDAGTPLISDPGAVLVKEAAQMGLEMTTLPGACAAVAAVSLSGHGGAWAFRGFFSKKSGERKAQMARVAESEIPSVIYESPHALVKTLGALAEECGDGRDVVVAKELTKLHERVYMGTLGEASSFFTSPVKGEYVIIVDSAPQRAEPTDEEIRALIEQLRTQGMTKKDAAKAASEKLGVRPNRAYRITL